MRLFANSATNFIKLSSKYKIADKLKEEYKHQFENEPDESEYNSWNNSLFELAKVLKPLKLKNTGVILEYQLPLYGKRLDVILCGKDQENNRHAVIIELKQWHTCRLTDYDSEYVITYVAGDHRPKLHPSIQVGNYMLYLKDNSSVFYEGSMPIKLSACSYLHNYTLSANDVLIDGRFKEALRKYPMYTSDHTAALASFINSSVGYGDGVEMIEEIEKSHVRTSKKLLEEVASQIKQKLDGKLGIFGHGKSKGDFILLDEQLIVYDAVMNILKQDTDPKQKYSIIVKAGAGTGKSVLALQLLADLSATGRKAHMATGSRAFTSTLRKILTDNWSLVNYFISYGKKYKNKGPLDVLILDEAHRLRENPEYYREMPNFQIRELIDAAKMTIFFTDDHQIVRNGETGTASYIKEQAEIAGCKTYQYDLSSQFRNGGSDRYGKWLLKMLDIEKTGVKLWMDEPHFEFGIIDSPEALKEIIMDKHREGFESRIVSGFCWPWSEKVDENRKIKKDIKIGDFEMPWNAREEHISVENDIPESHYWAYDTRGIDQVGCIYSAQGFEFDYVGVIFGKDLRYNPSTGNWMGFPEENHDLYVKKSTYFLQLIKNTYGVLLSRASKGCFVYFMDKATEVYFRNSIKS